MALAYSPTENKGGDSVRHLCHEDSWFWSPATFPGAQTPMDYATSHSVVMASVSDLHIIRFDQVFAKNGHVLLRYTAEGSHSGKPYKGIPPSGKHARWSAAAIFEVQDGKIMSFTKDWDQKTMQVTFEHRHRASLALLIADRYNLVGRRSRRAATQGGMPMLWQILNGPERRRRSERIMADVWGLIIESAGASGLDWELICYHGSGTFTSDIAGGC